jgi:hypothetical protein
MRNEIAIANRLLEFPSAESQALPCAIVVLAKRVRREPRDALREAKMDAILSSNPTLFLFKKPINTSREKPDLGVQPGGQ